MVDQPPIYHNGDEYDTWRANIVAWKDKTNIDKKRQALAVRAKLDGKLREVALQLDAADLNKEDGMKYLLGKLDASFRKGRRRKWDVPAENKQDDPKKLYGGDPALTAAEKARLRASKLSAKLAAEGKYHSQPMSLLPSAIANPVDQFNNNKRLPALNGKSLAPVILPEVKKLDSGGYIAHFVINDVNARIFLTKGSTQELIEKQSGTSITLRGEYTSEEEKRRTMISGVDGKLLTIVIQADVAAKIQVAIHKISQVIHNFQKSGGMDRNLNNFGLSQEQQNQHQFVQDKLFVGLDDVSPDLFDVKKALTGDNNENFQFVVQQTGAKVMLRGRNSGYIEQNSGRESFEALHIYINHSRQDGLESTRQLCGNLIDTVRRKVCELKARRPTNQPYQRTGPTYQQQPAAVALQHRVQPYRHMQYPHLNNAQYQPHYPLTQDLRGPTSSASIASHPQSLTAEQNRKHAIDGDDARNNSRHREEDEREKGHSSDPRHKDVKKGSHYAKRRERSRSRSPQDSHPKSVYCSRSHRDNEDKRDKLDGRKFSEEPKKRRKFSEDPKLLEKKHHSREETSLRFEHKKDENVTDSDSFVSPSSFSLSLEKTKERSIHTPKDKRKSSPDFAFPLQPDIFKTPKALKTGALSTLTAYADDSDSD